MHHKPTSTEIRLHNGDVLIAHTAQRDPKVDAAFRDASGEARKRNQQRIADFRRLRRDAA